MPAWFGASARSSFQTSSDEPYSHGWPIRAARSTRMRMSSRAWPGGSSALRTRCTRRSEFVTVPSPSHQLADAGRTTSATSAVLVRKMSCTTTCSRRSNRCLTWCASASDWIGFSPRTNIVVSSPRSMASNISVMWRPYVRWSSTPQAASYLATALHVVLAAQRVEPRAVAADVAGQQREVDEREDVVDRVVVFGDPERPADLRAVGPGVCVRDLLDDVRRDAGERLAALEGVGLDRGG